MEVEGIMRFFKRSCEHEKKKLFHPIGFRLVGVHKSQIGFAVSNRALDTCHFAHSTLCTFLLIAQLRVTCNRVRVRVRVRVVSFHRGVMLGITLLLMHVRYGSNTTSGRSFLVPLQRFPWQVLLFPPP